MTSLRRRPLKTLRKVVEVTGPGAREELRRILGPIVGARHPAAVYRRAAGLLIQEREEARAKRLGEPRLSAEEQAVLASAGSRLLGLDPVGSPLAGISDEALESVRTEGDPGRLAEALRRLDPDGDWGRVPRVGVFRGLVLVAVSSEQHRRWRRKEAANLARTRGQRRRAKRAATG